MRRYASWKQNWVTTTDQEKDLNIVQLLYNDGASTMEISYNQKTIFIDEYFLSNPQSELEEIQCGNITFYTFTMTYTNEFNEATTAPLYFAEIEPGVYIYTNLGDTLQSGKVDEEKLKADLEMLKEAFLNVETSK